MRLAYDHQYNDSQPSSASLDLSQRNDVREYKQYYYLLIHICYYDLLFTYVIV